MLSAVDITPAVTAIDAAEYARCVAARSVNRTRAAVQLRPRAADGHAATPRAGGGGAGRAQANAARPTAAGARARRGAAPRGPRGGSQSPPAAAPATPDPPACDTKGVTTRCAITGGETTIS